MRKPEGDGGLDKDCGDSVNPTCFVVEEFRFQLVGTV
jgi:hypothetical protein